MAKYRVVYKTVDYVYLDVEANSLEEAQEIAENDSWFSDNPDVVEVDEVV